jgi:hypothetical protein
MKFGSTFVARVRNVALLAAVAAGVSVGYLASSSSAQVGSDAVNLMMAKNITGTVVNIDNKPVAVQVKLLTKGSGAAGGPQKRGPNDSPTGDSVVGAPEAEKLQKNPGAIQPGEKLVKEMTSSADGKFTFQAVPQGSYVVLAGSGRNAARVNVEVKDNADPAPLALKLPNK